jgi:hypothetical protein
MIVMGSLIGHLIYGAVVGTIYIVEGAVEQNAYQAELRK